MNSRWGKDFVISSSGGNASASQDVEKILLSNAAQSVLEMGYQPKMIKRAIEEMLLQNSKFSNLLSIIFREVDFPFCKVDKHNLKQL